ncbi:MAG: hypothetical protein Q4E89_06060 [Eubacteriales bacterium]|nr:hypothetical protein [Eubacteriales bacterium]
MEEYIRREEYETQLLARHSLFRFKWFGEDTDIQFQFFKNGNLAYRTSLSVRKNTYHETEGMEILKGLYDVKIFLSRNGRLEEEPSQILLNVRIGNPYKIYVEKKQEQHYGSRGVAVRVHMDERDRQELSRLHFFYQVNGIKYRVPVEYWDGFFVADLLSHAFCLECEENPMCVDRPLICDIQ